jgi:hypothetical protein
MTDIHRLKSRLFPVILCRVLVRGAATVLE